jgi:hypothetical protein
LAVALLFYSSTVSFFNKYILNRRKLTALISAVDATYYSTASHDNDNKQQQNKCEQLMD